MRISTIGGNVAENSGGLRGLKYGVTRDYVMGLEVVLADGEIARLGNKCVKDVAGYSLKDLFIGSEGTLGIITEVLLKLVPRPAARRTMLALYDRDRGRGRDGLGHHRGADHSLHAGVPRSHDRRLRRGLRARRPADRLRGGAADGDRRPSGGRRRRSRADGGDRARATAPAKCARREDEAEALALAAARRNAFSALARRRPTTILEDVTVPRSELAKMVSVHRRDRRASTTCRSARSATWATATCTRRSSPTSATPTRCTRVHQALDAIVTEDARARRHDHRRARRRPGEEAVAAPADGRRSFELMRQVKRALDPNGLLNPGKIFD